MMNLKPCLILFLFFFFLAVANAMVSAEASKVHEFSFQTPMHVGDLIGEENEMLLDSESNRRTLAGRRQKHISYGALKAGQTPCGRRGQSYYDCQKRGQANPYRRACTAITHCARDTS